MFFHQLPPALLTVTTNFRYSMLVACDMDELGEWPVSAAGGCYITQRRSVLASAAQQSSFHLSPPSPSRSDSKHRANGLLDRPPAGSVCIEVRRNGNFLRSSEWDDSSDNEQHSLFEHFV